MVTVPSSGAEDTGIKVRAGAWMEVYGGADLSAGVVACGGAAMLSAIGALKGAAHASELPLMSILASSLSMSMAGLAGLAAGRKCDPCLSNVSDLFDPLHLAPDHVWFLWTAWMCVIMCNGYDNVTTAGASRLG